MTTTNLPALTGTPKQVAWAEDIRRKQLAEVAGYIAQTREQGTRQPEKAAMFDALIAAVEADIPTRTDASWWIDNQHTAWREVWAVGVAAAQKVGA